MRPMTRNMWREIDHAKGRFIAIVLIILLGVLIFVGVKAAGPALNDSAAKTVTDQRLSDVTILSTTGFSKADVAAIDGVSGGRAEAVSFKYALGGKGDRAIALYGYDAGLKQNQLMMVSGRKPRHGNEIVLDEQAKITDHYKLGQRFQFAKSAGLRQRTYTIVGFANSPMYLDNSQRGACQRW